MTKDIIPVLDSDTHETQTYAFDEERDEYTYTDVYCPTCGYTGRLFLCVERPVQVTQKMLSPLEALNYDGEPEDWDSGSLLDWPLLLDGIDSIELMGDDEYFDHRGEVYCGQCGLTCHASELLEDVSEALRLSREYREDQWASHALDAVFEEDTPVDQVRERIRRVVQGFSSRDQFDVSLNMSDAGFKQYDVDNGSTLGGLYKIAEELIVSGFKSSPDFRIRLWTAHSTFLDSELKLDMTNGIRLYFFKLTVIDPEGAGTSFFITGSSDPDDDRVWVTEMLPGFATANDWDEELCSKLDWTMTTRDLLEKTLFIVHELTPDGLKVELSGVV